MAVMEDALRVYRRVVDENLSEALGAGVAISERRGIFSSAVVIWLMIFQRLNSDHSLAAAVEHLRSGELNELLEEGSLPARANRISSSTGGFSRARERISLEVVEKVADGINEALGKNHRKGTQGGKQVYVIDGSTLRVPYTQDNIEKYPQYQNQHGKAHFPLLRIGIATNALTGMVLRPSYGPYSGEHATNELTLAEELFGRIPRGSVIIADRFFGCSRFADLAKRAGHEVVTRVKEINAKKFIGTAASASGELAVEWKSRTGEYSASGRFIWHTVTRKGFRPSRLVLFTTSPLPRKEILKLYGLRWNVELDLRDIKSTLDMDMLYNKTPSMNEKEIVLGITAYNLIRHLVVAAATSLKVTPREISFSRVLKRIHAVGNAAFNSSVPITSNSGFIIHSDLRGLLLPKRKNTRPAEPRKVWQKGQVTFMTKTRDEERKKLEKYKINDNLNEK
jgi:hypothetical protein